MQHRFWNFVSHASAILAGMFVVFFCIDRVNPAMDFLGSALSKWLLLAFAIFALINGVCSAAYLFRKKRRAHHGETHAPQRRTGRQEGLPAQSAKRTADRPELRY